ncbi:3124_t:CDS:2, partial [Acaulospora colombiana]
NTMPQTNHTPAEDHTTMDKPVMTLPPSLNAHSRLLRETWKTARRLEDAVIHYPESWEPFKQVSIPLGADKERISDLETEISRGSTTSDSSNDPKPRRRRTSPLLATPSSPIQTVIKFYPSVRSSTRLRGQWVLLLALYDPYCTDVWVIGNSEYFDKWAENW